MKSRGWATFRMALKAGFGEFDFSGVEVVLDDDPVEHALLARQCMKAEIGNRDREKTTGKNTLDRVQCHTP